MLFMSRMRVGRMNSPTGISAPPEAMNVLESISLRSEVLSPTTTGSDSSPEVMANSVFSFNALRSVWSRVE